MLHGKCKKEIEELTEKKRTLEGEIQKSGRNNRELREKLSAVEDELKKKKEQLGEMARLAKKYKDACVGLEKECDRLMNAAPQNYAIFYRKHPGGRKDEIDVLLHGQLVKIVCRIKDVSVDDLKCGWEIIMNQSGNTAVATTKDLWRWGDQVYFKAKLSEELVLVSGDGSTDNFQCILAPDLKGTAFRQGDLFLNCGGLLVKALPKTEERDHDIQSVPDLDFTKVGGLSAQIDEIQEALLPFVERELYVTELKGEDMPKGIILDGPPGCGKTLLARVIASYLSRQKGKDGYFMALTSTELINKYVGETERKMRELFSRAKEKARESGLVVIFIDEIDALVRRRDMAMDKEPWKGDSVAQFCGLLDGIEPLADVLVIGATNFKDLIDPAILRPGRLTVHIRVPRPDLNGAREILNIHLPPDLPFARKYFSEITREYTDHFGTGQRELAETDKDPVKIRKHFVDAILSRIFYCGPAKAIILKSGQEEETELVVDNKIEYYEDGKLRVTYLKDHLSGDMLKNIVDKARRIALSRFIPLKRANPEFRMEMFKRDFFEAVDAEYVRIATSLKAVRTNPDKEKGKIGFSGDEKKK